MLTLEQVLARAMKSSRGPTAKPSSLKIDANLQKVSREKRTGRLSFARPVTPPNEGFGASPPKVIPLDYPEPEPVPKTPSLTLNGADLTLSLKSAKALGDWRGALSVFTTALFGTHAYRPNEQHLKQFMGILRTEDKLDVALQILHDFDTLMDHGKIEKPESEDKPSAPTNDATDVKNLKDQMYQLLLRAHADTKQWESALHVLNTMIERNYTFPRTDTMNTVLSAMDDGKNWDRALNILEQMIRARKIHEGTLSASDAPLDETSLVSVYDNALPNTVTYATTITMLESAGKYDLAQKIMRDIPKTDRDAIMRSYAAVIHVWSMRHHRSGKRHGRIL